MNEVTTDSKALECEVESMSDSLKSDAKGYMLWDIERRCWVGSLGKSHAVINIFAVMVVWYCAISWNLKWPVICYLCLMPTWALSGGYGGFEKWQRAWFISSLIALSPALASQIVWQTNGSMIGWIGLLFLIVVSVGMAIFRQCQQSEEISLKRSLGPLWLLGSILIAVTAIFSTGIALAMLEYFGFANVPLFVSKLPTIATFIGSSYVIFALYRAWVVVFNTGWPESDRSVGSNQSNRAHWEFVARLGRFAEFSIRKVVEHLIEDSKSLVLFAIRWSSDYSLLLVCFAATKVCYGYLAGALIAYLDSEGVGFLLFAGVLAVPALFLHLCAASIMYDILKGKACVSNRGLDVKPEVLNLITKTKESVGKLIRVRSSETAGLLMTALVALVLMPGIPVMMLTKEWSLLWVMGAIPYGLLGLAGWNLRRTATPPKS